MKKVTVDSSTIRIEFDYDPMMVELVKRLPDRSYDKNSRQWLLPLSPFHVGQVIAQLEPAGFQIDPRLHNVMGKHSKRKFLIKRDGLYDFQSECIDFLDTAGGRALIADEQGLGKTIESLYWIAQHPEIRRVLVVCPASVVYKWVAEIKKWDSAKSVDVVMKGSSPIPDTDYVVMSYAIMTRQIGVLSEMRWDCFIADECFPGDTMVETDRGSLRIDEIVNNKMGVFVKSCNSSTSVVELKKVTGWIKKPLANQLVRVIHEFGSFICTENHPVYTEEDGYVEARTLLRGKTLRILWTEVSNSQVWADQILWKEMFGHMENQSTRVQEGIYTENKRGKGKEGKLGIRQTKKIIIRRNEEEQSNVDAGSKRQDDSIKQRENFPISWRKRTINNPTGSSSIKDRRSFRVSNWNTKVYPGRVRLSTRLLQGRYWISRVLFSNRGRWKDSQTTKVEVSRQEERSYTIPSRVVSVEVYKPRDRRECGEGSTDYQFVYCLDVEDNHNFFADGVLVHNCHRLKSEKAQRSRAAKNINAKYFLALSGTPILNRPIEFFNVLNMINPKVWGSWWNYAHRYCGAHQTYWGLDSSGASNLDELASRVAPYMIRRLKKDVLTELPDLTRTKVPVRVDGAEIVTAYRTLYESLRVGGKGSGADAMVHLNVLRQAIGRSKIPFVIELAEGVLDADEDAKVVIYAVHRHVVSQLEIALRKYGVTTITGDVPNEERSVRCDRFQNMHLPRVMIISSAGGEGIDLYRSSVIIFAEREWGPATEEQAEARCHRIGQENAVEAIYVIAKGTIDEDIDELIESKRSILGQVITQADVHLDITDELLSRIMRKGVK